MRIDLPSSEGWFVVSEGFRKTLPFPSENLTVQVYAGFEHALFETARGLARLFSHKKTIAVIDGSEMAIEAIAVDYSEEAYQVRRIRAEERQDFAAWLAPLATDLIFVIYAEDDPVTGRLFDHSDWLPQLTDKRIFKIAVSHAAYRHRESVRPLPFEVRLLSVRDDLAVLVAGERFKVFPTLAPRMSWPLEEATSLAPVVSDALARIEAFESDLPEGFKAYFARGEARLPDRAVFYCPTIDGSALLEIMGLQDRNLADTTSPCRWRHPRFRDWLLARGESEELVRGLVVIDAALIDSALKAKIAAAATEIRSL